MEGIDAVYCILIRWIIIYTKLLKVQNEKKLSLTSTTTRLHQFLFGLACADYSLERNGNDCFSDEPAWISCHNSTTTVTLQIVLPGSVALTQQRLQLDVSGKISPAVKHRYSLRLLLWRLMPARKKGNKF